MLLAGHKLELAGSQPRLEAGANLGIGGFAHAATQGVAEDVALIGDGLALKAAVAGKGYGLAGDPLRSSRDCAACMRSDARSRASATTLSA